MPKIILASQSPRRKSLLERMGIATFETIPSGYEEKLDDSRDVHEVAKELALGKALEVAKNHPDAVVVASDTIVVVGNRQLEKPIDIKDARQMLIDLGKSPSSVITSVAVVQGDKHLVDTDVTQVFFKPDSPEISAAREVYLASNDWKDKAGGYGIQSGAAPLIDHIEGDYDTVVGLPTKLLVRLLAKFDIHADPVIEASPVPQVATVQTHFLHLDPKPFELIASGAKTIESRLYDEKRRLIRPGDTIIFSSREESPRTASVKVTRLHRYATFHDLFSSNKPELFGGESLEQLEEAIGNFYTLDDQKQYGVVGIEFELL